MSRSELLSPVVSHRLTDPYSSLLGYDLARTSAEATVRSRARGFAFARATHQRRGRDQVHLRPGPSACGGPHRRNPYLCPGLLFRMDLEIRAQRPNNRTRRPTASRGLCIDRQPCHVRADHVRVFSFEHDGKMRCHSPCRRIRDRPCGWKSHGHLYCTRGWPRAVPAVSRVRRPRPHESHSSRRRGTPTRSPSGRTRA